MRKEGKMEGIKGIAIAISKYRKIQIIINNYRKVWRTFGFSKGFNLPPLLTTNEMDC